MNERIRRLTVLIERADGQKVGWELNQPGTITATASEGVSLSRSTKSRQQHFTLYIGTDGPVRRILPEEFVIEDGHTIEGEIVG